MTNPLIHLEEIQKFYGDFHALRGVTLDIQTGEFFSLLGPSGCGKTTLLRTIAGFETPSAGRVSIDGADMNGVPANRRPTNMVFQSYAIFPHLSVEQNVGFGLRRSGRDKADQTRAVGEALEMVGLQGYGARASHELSGGQRQRVALARALIMHPKVLLLDEPLSALDKKLREAMQSELRRLQRQVGITFILVTHDQEEALIMSDRIAVMFDGQIAQLATPQDLYRRPSSREVAGFIGVMNFLPGKLTGLSIDIAGLGKAEIGSEQINGKDNGSVTVGVRPESMSVLFEGDPSAEFEASGKVAEREYFGDMTYYDVLLEGTDEVVAVSMKNIEGRRVLNRGDDVRLGWDPRALVVFS